MLALIFRTNERPAEFEGGADFQEEALVVAETGVGVKALDAVLANNLIGDAGAVRSGQLLLFLIP